MATYLLSGDDEAVLRTTVRELLHQLVGDNDVSMMVEEFDDAEFTMQAVADSAHTPPFLTERRVVVARNVGRFNTADIEPILAFLEDPLESTDLVLVGGGGAVPKKLTDAVKACGGEVRNGHQLAAGTTPVSGFDIAASVAAHLDAVSKDSSTNVENALA